MVLRVPNSGFSGRPGFFLGRRGFCLIPLKETLSEGDGFVLFFVSSGREESEQETKGNRLGFGKR